MQPWLCMLIHFLTSLEPARLILESRLLQIHLHVWSDEHAGDL